MGRARRTSPEVVSTFSSLGVLRSTKVTCPETVLARISRHSSILHSMGPETEETLTFLEVPETLMRPETLSIRRDST